MDERRLNGEGGNQFGEERPLDSGQFYRRELIEKIRYLATKADAPPVNDSGIAKQLIEMADAVGRQPLTRRNLLQLTAIGAMLVFINSTFSTANNASCSLRAPLAGCRREEELPATGPDFSAAVLRKEDMLALRFDFYHLKLNGSNLERMRAGGDAYIVVNFAHENDNLPQSVGEEAYLETAAELSDETEDPHNEPNPPGGSETPDQPGYVGARLAGGSRLVFKIPPGSPPIPFTMEELLSWEKYELSVTPTALPADEQSPGQEPVAPLYWQTAIEAPWQLIVSPNRYAGWAHALTPVTRNQRTELWHTRLGVRKPDLMHPDNWTVDEKQEAYRTMRAVWARDFDRANEPDANDLSPFRMSLTRNDRWQLVRLTSDYNIQATRAGTQLYNPSPVQVERFMLSSLGAWMDTRGEWPGAPSAAGLDIIEWRHLAAMARDNYVRVVYKGFLFPTGHSATLVKVTERKVQAVPSGGSLAGKPAAYLRQRFYIVVRQPLKSYPAHSSQPFQGREWPFASVRITTLITPTLDNPNIHGDAYDLVGKGQKAFWPRVAGQDFKFHMIGQDTDGHQTEFTCPLAFISSTLQQPGDVSSFIEPAINSYNSGVANTVRRQRPLQGQKVALAASSKADGLPDGKPGDTSAEVKIMTLGATLPEPPVVSLPENQARFFPTWQEAEVRLPSAEQASGRSLPGPVVIHLLPEYCEKGFNPATNPGYIWALLKDAVQLSFDGAGDKSGAIVTPNIGIVALSRTIGVVGGSPGSPPAMFDPVDFFSDAKILGGILLAQIIKSANFGDGRKAPRLSSNLVYPNGNNTLPPEAFETRLDWEPELVEDPLGIFEPSSETSMEIKGTFITPLDPPGEPEFNITGDLRSFWINMIGKNFLFLRIHFSKICFTSETGKKPVVDVDIDRTDFAGPLEFVNPLKNFLESLGTGMSIDITPTQISTGFKLPIPKVTVGIVAIQNISLGVKLVIPFTGNPARVRFNFCEKEQPFLLTVFALGGGGYFAIEVGLDGVERLEAALEFGASMSLDFKVATGKVKIVGGIYFEMEKVGQPEETVALTSYIRINGSLKVLGLITVSVEFYLGMKFQKPPNELYGQAKLTIKVEVLFFSASVEVSVERRIAGGDGGDSSQSLSAARADFSPVRLGSLQASETGGNFEDLMNQEEWSEYTKAFAPVPEAV